MQSPSDHSPTLLGIPPELRLQIYRYIFETRPRKASVTVAQIREDKYPAGCISVHHTIPGQSFYLTGSKDHIDNLNWYGQLLQTCKLINEEATDLLFEMMPLEIFLCPQRDDFEDPQMPSVAPHHIQPRRLRQSVVEPTFFRRFRKVHITVSNQSLEKELRNFPSTLGHTLAQLNSPREQTVVDMSLGFGDEELIWHHEPAWNQFLAEMKSVAERCRFDLWMEFMNKESKPKYEELSRVLGMETKIHNGRGGDHFLCISEPLESWR